MQITQDVLDQTHRRDSVWGVQVIETITLEGLPAGASYKLRYIIEIDMIYSDQSSAYVEVWDLERLEWRRIMFLAGSAWAETAQYTPENRRRMPPEILAARDELRRRVAGILRIEQREGASYASPAG